MEYRLLGPLAVFAGDRPVELREGKQRALLTLLLLRTNEVVPSEQLIDELWSDSAPPTAAKIVQNYISQLRKALESDESSDILETCGRGYRLRVAPGEIDVDRFEQLLDEGRRALAAGEPDRGASSLHEALALWRGPALADVAYEAFAQSEIARLEERRLVALEERIDADLALGRHEDLVAEIENLVSRYPLRERLRGQLMLALYRSGRQAEALSAYRDTRTLLSDELGLEPGQELRRLEGAILRHDPSLDPPPRIAARAAAGPRRRRLARVLVPVGVLLAGAISAAAVLLSEEDGSANGRILGNAVGVIDLDSGRVVESIPVGLHPTSIAVGEGAVWVLNADDQTISRIDPQTKATRAFATGSKPADLAVGAGAVWVGNLAPEPGSPVMTTLSKLDAESGLILSTTTLRRVARVGIGHGSSAGGSTIAAVDGAVWVVNPDLTVSRLDPGTGRVVTTIRSIVANTLAADEESVWVVNRDSTLSRIDPRTNLLTATVRVPAASLNAVTVGAGAVWATDPLGGSVWRIDPRPSGAVMRTIPVAPGVAAISYGGGSIWAINGSEETVTRIDPLTNRVVATIETGNPPLAVAAGAGSVWISVADRGHTSATGESAEAAGVAASCGEVLSRNGERPRYLIVSDLPLQGRSRTQALSIVEAIRLVLRERDFKAGRYTIGYQSCDDSTAQAQSFEYERCASNARAYAENARVLGVLGAYNSDCSLVQLPFASRAPGGPLPMVSPSNDSVGLTKPAPSARPGQLEALYPTGERNYFRVYPAADAQAAAVAQLARSLGVERVFVLRDLDGGGHGIDLAHFFEESAGRLGLSIVGSGTWNARAAGYRGLARTIKRSRAEGVLLAGEVYSNGGRLVKDLRAVLGSGTTLLATDGFSRAKDTLAAAGTAAEGLYVSTPGTPLEQLGPAGKRFVDEFQASRPRWFVPDYYWAPYAAQAAEVLLDAIERSDGSRASVLRELRATEVVDGILGDFKFDRNGDVAPAAITILRIRRGGAGMTALGADFADGALVDRVIRPQVNEDGGSGTGRG